MIASGADIAAEYYFSILLDRSNRRHLAMCSREGGMDIETLAKERPEALARVPLDPAVGIDAEVARHIAKEAGFDEETAEAIAPVLETLWTVYRDEDATLVEVNPLVSSPDGSVWAVDGKVTLERQRALPPPRPRRAGGRGRAGSARGRSEGSRA